MKYTKEQLQGMSDLEINRVLAELDGGYLGDTGDWLKDGVEVKAKDFGYYEKSYCNKWNDVMPLAVEHQLATMPVYFPDIIVWQATSMKKHKAWRDTKMQRAVACCLILVLQEGEE